MITIMLIVIIIIITWPLIELVITWYQSISWPLHLHSTTKTTMRIIDNRYCQHASVTAAMTTVQVHISKCTAAQQVTWNVDYVSWISWLAWRVGMLSPNHVDMQKPESAAVTTETVARHFDILLSYTKAQRICAETKARQPMQQIY